MLYISGGLCERPQRSSPMSERARVNGIICIRGNRCKSIRGYSGNCTVDSCNFRRKFEGNAWSSSDRIWIFRRSRPWHLLTGKISPLSRLLSSRIGARGTFNFILASIAVPSPSQRAVGPPEPEHPRKEPPSRTGGDERIEFKTDRNTGDHLKKKKKKVTRVRSLCTLRSMTPYFEMFVLFSISCHMCKKHLALKVTVHFSNFLTLPPPAAPGESRSLARRKRKPVE